MMTDRQLTHLINYIRLEAQHYSQFAPAPDHEVLQARRELTKAFGFEHHRNGYPKTPEPHPQTLPPAKPVCSQCGQITGPNHVCTAGDIARQHDAWGDQVVAEGLADGSLKRCERCGTAYLVQAGHAVCEGPRLATSDPEGHRQAIADADYDAKREALHELCARIDPTIPMLDPEEIMRHWSDLKAIMEPNGDAVDRSLIESLIRDYAYISYDDLVARAEGEPVAAKVLSGNQALAILAARARLKA